MNLFISNPLAAALLLAMVRVTLLLSLAWFSHVLLRNKNPGWQIMIWRGTAVGIPVIMILSFLIPGWGLSFSDLDQQVGRLLPPMIEMSAEINEYETSGSEAVASTASSTSTTGNSPDSSPSTILAPTSAKIVQKRPRLSLGAILLMTYVLVTSFLLFRLLRQGMGLRRLLNEAAASNADVDGMRSEVCHRLELKREPAVLQKSLNASVDHKELDLPPNDNGNLYFRHYRFSTAPGETAQFNLTVQPKDAVVIGR